MSDTNLPTIDQLLERRSEKMFRDMSLQLANKMIREAIYRSVKEEGVPIKCHGEPLDGRSPYLVHEEDDWFDVLHDNGRYKSGTPTLHRLNIWLDYQTHQWRWTLYDSAWANKKTIGSKGISKGIAHGDAVPILD